MPAPSDHVRLLAKYVAPQGWRVAALAALLVGGVALQLINPQLVRRFLDKAEHGGSLEQLFYTALLFMAVAIVAQVVRVAAGYLSQVVAWTATNELRADLAEHCLKLDLAFHKQHKPGELIERVDGDVAQLSEFFSQAIIQLGTNALLIAGVMVLLFAEDWRVGATLSLLVALGLVVLRYASGVVVPRWERLRQIESEIYGDVEEWLGGTEAIQSCGAAPYVIGKLHRSLRVRWHAQQAAQRAHFLVMGVPVVVPTLAYIAAYLWGAKLHLSGTMTVGGVYLIFYYIDVVRDPLWSMQRQFDQLQRATAGVRRVAALFAERPSLTDGAVDSLPSGPLAVSVDSVTFAYDEENAHAAALQDVSIRLDAGKVLGVLGRTGSGKTTLARLLCRFLDPSAGRIELGDGDDSAVDLRELTIAALRRRIGFVTQDVQLMHASVRDNLTLFDDDVSDDHLTAALDELGMRSWLDALPNGLETELRGTEGLSAGEAQLLSLARVFLTDPGLVILDEASSRLDPATERLVDGAVRRLAEGRTMVVIAHRLATVSRADELLILSGGRVIEHGARDALAADETSHFRQLLAVGLEEALV